MKKVVLSVLALLVVAFNVHAVPELRLPFQGGETWRCSQGNYDDPKVPNDTHYGRLKYAWDFHLPGDADLGSPVVAPAAGMIVYADWATGGWGNTVIINYGDGSYGKITHMLPNLEVKEDNYVVQGQIVGYCGSTGYSTGEHIHYQTQDGKETWSQSIPS